MTVAGQVPTKEQTATGPKDAAPKKATTKKAPGKAVAKVTKPQEKSDFTPSRAKSHTDKIRKGASATWEDITKAYTGRIWLALGHKSWDEYCDKEFDGVPLALPREKKKQAIESLATSGFSSRAIAAATGVSQRTAARGAATVTDPKPKPPEPNGSPGEVIDAEVVEDGLDEFAPAATESEPREVLGKDGKTYTIKPSEPKPTEPKQEPHVNIVSAARSLSKELENVRIRLDALFSRDDYEENSVAVQGTLETVVGDFIDTLVDEFADLISERLPESEPEPV